MTSDERIPSDFQKGYARATDETFSFIAKSWNVSHAKAILRETPREKVSIQVKDLKQFVGVIRDEGQEAIDEADLDKPIILVWVKIPADYREQGDPDSYCFPIDGWHRIKKAIQTGADQLFALVLSKEESEQVTL